MTQETEAGELLLDMRMQVEWTDQATMPIELYIRIKNYIENARVSRGEVKAINNLRAVLCDPEGNVCIHGSDGDRQVIQNALAALSAQAKPVEVGVLVKQLWPFTQYMPYQVFDESQHKIDEQRATAAAQAIIERFNVTVKPPQEAKDE